MVKIYNRNMCCIPFNPLKSEGHARHFSPWQNDLFVPLSCKYRRTQCTINPGHNRSDKIKYCKKISGFLFSLELLYARLRFDFVKFRFFYRFIYRCMCRYNTEKVFSLHLYFKIFRKVRLVTEWPTKRICKRLIAAKRRVEHFLKKKASGAKMHQM